MLKRVLVATVIIACLIGTSILFASGQTEKAAAAEKAKPKVRIFCLDSFKKLFDGTAGAKMNLIETLEKEFELEWNLVPWKGSEQKTKTLIADPNPQADAVCFLDRWSGKSIFENLETLNLSEIDDADDIVEGAVNNCMFQGQLKGIPFRGAYFVMFYNKDLYEERLGKTDPPKNMKEFWDNAKKCTYKRSDGAQVYGVTFPGGANVTGAKYINDIAMCYGAEILSQDLEIKVTEQGMTQALKDMAWAYKEGIIPPNFETMSTGDARNLLTQRLAAHMVENWKVYPSFNNPEKSRVAGQIAAAAKPAWEKLGKDLPKHVVGTWNWVIPKKIPEANKKAAWEFIKMITSPDFALELSLNTNGPIRRSIFSNAKYKETDPLADVLNVTAPVSGIHAPPFDGTSECLEIFGEEATFAIKGTKSPEAAMKSAATRIQTVLDRWGIK
jgi:multiple sugar transport system substrate-binding protein